MELIELIGKITNFKNSIIRVNQYMSLGGNHYMILIEARTYSERYEIAIGKMKQQIENEIDIIDNELEALKTLNNVEYQNIVNTYLPHFIKILKSSFFVEHYPFGTSIIEKHIEQNNTMTNELVENNRTEVNVEDEIPKFEITTIPDRVRLLMELGIIEHLEKELPMLIGKKKKLTELLMQFLNIPYNSLQPVVNAIEYDDESPRKPKLTKKVQNVLNKYK